MFVIPAYAGIQGVLNFIEMNWMPAFAGMTDSDFAEGQRDSTDFRASMIAADDYAAAFKPRIFAGLSQLTVLISSLLRPNASI